MFDLNDYFDFKRNVPSFIEFNFNRLPSVGIKIKLSDKRKSLTRRTLESSYFDFEGMPIEIEELNSGDYHEFTLKFLEKVNLKSENKQSCEDYPTKKFPSYNDCDMAYVYNKMKNVYKIMPFWAARTLDEVTNLT